MTFSEDIKQKKQSIFLSKWIYIFIISIVFGAFFYYFSIDKTVDLPKIVSTYITQKGDLEIYVSGEGKVISGKKIELNFPVSGTIKGIYKNEGEIVITGEKVAELDDDIYKLNLEKANINLKSTYAELEGIKETVSNSELKVLEKSLNLAQKHYDNTKLKLISSLENDKNNFNSLVIQRANLINDIKIEKSNLELLITDEDKKINNLETTLDFKGNILILDIEKYLNKIDELVGITPLNKDANDDFEYYLGAKDTNLKTKLISDFNILNNNVLNNKQLLNYNLLISYSSSLKNLLNLTIQLISNSIESTSFTVNEIQNYKSLFQGYLSALELSHQSYSLAYDTLDYEKTNKDILLQKQNNIIEGLIGDLELINEDVNNYSNKLSNLEKTNESELMIAQQELEKAQLEYNNSIAGPTSTVLKPYYIDIENAKSNVKEAEKNLSDTILNSPVNGTVLDINYREGEFYGTKQESFGVIISANNKYIESYIEERDIAYIKVGQFVKVNVDAFENYSFTGVVNYVSTLGEEDKDEVIKYKVLISFDDGNDQLRDSMSVSLNFLHEKLNNILLVPNEYIIYIDGVSNVVLLDGTYREVEEGISDGEYTQIISGLDDGEKIGLIKE